MQYLPGDLAQLQVDNEDIKRRQQMAQAFQQAGFNPVQGGNQALSLLASVMSTLRGNSMMKDSSKSLSENLAKQFEVQNQADQAKADAERARRDEDYQRDLQKLDYGNASAAKYRDPGNIDPLSPEGMAATLRLEKAKRAGQPGPGPSESDRKIAQLRALGATDDQIRSMLLGNQGQSRGRATPEHTQLAAASGAQLKALQEKLMASKGLRSDALDFVAANTGITKADLEKMTPADVAKAFKTKSGITANPILGRISTVLGGPNTEGMASSAAAKQARINNPVGVVTGADVDQARSQVFGQNISDENNARLIEQYMQNPENYAGEIAALQAQMGGQAPAAPQAAQGQPPMPQSDAEYAALPSGTKYIDPDDGKTYRKP